MVGAPTVDYGNKTNKFIEAFQGNLPPIRLNAFGCFTTIRNKLKAWSWIAENYFKNNLPSKGIPVRTKTRTAESDGTAVQLSFIYVLQKVPVSYLSYQFQLKCRSS
jgi:hypothetical protein